jgi:RNA polymerase sigma-70 factor (ECF subfamily)
MAYPESEMEALLRRAGHGEAEAQAALWTHYRERLRRAVALRMDHRLSTRIDPSDVVQETFLDASQGLDRYLDERPLPFYPWLRQIALNRLTDLHRRHLLAKKRSVLREQQQALPLPDDSFVQLVDRLMGSGTSPSNHLARKEGRSRVQQALEELGEKDRELLLLRYLEKMSAADIAAVLGISEGAVKVRHFRALEKIRKLLEKP